MTLLPGLIAGGHRVHLLCHPKTLLEERARQSGVVVHPIAFRQGAGIPAFFRFLSILRRVRPDVLAFNTPRPITLGSLASRISPVSVRIIFRRVNFPLRRNPLTRLKYRWGIDCIVAISESISHQLQSGGISESQIRIIYEGIDLGAFPERRYLREREPADPIILGTVAHLSEEKGLQYLVDAASHIPDARSRLKFVIVGDGNCRTSLEERVKECGLSGCFEFAGFLSDPVPVIRSFDIFVLPSLSEGLSSAILTAMATSLPVIATDVGGIPELVLHGENGLLVPARDSAALARAIEELANHPEKAFQMGQKGRKIVEERFTLERKILETERLCLSLLESKEPA